MATCLARRAPAFADAPAPGRPHIYSAQLVQGALFVTCLGDALFPEAARATVEVPLQEIRAAHERLEAGEQLGKIVLSI
jgi:hypothetical protein